MRLDDYLVNTESVQERVSVKNENEVVNTKPNGELACTSDRLVFTGDSDVIDISLNAVNTIEYKEGKPAGGAMAIGGLMIGLGAAAFTGGILGSEGAVMLAGVMLVALAAVVFILAYVFKRTKMEIHTPTDSYKFSSKEDLQTVAHAIRGHEN